MIRLATLNCNGLWSRAGRLNSVFQGLTTFLNLLHCDVALVQETNTPPAVNLPEDQPYCFDGLEDTRNHDAAFLVHRDIAGSCAQIPGISSHQDICWRLLRHNENHASTVIASFYAPHVGSPEPQRIEFWQRLSESVRSVMAALPNVDILFMGDSNLWLPGLVDGREARSADRACVEILNVMLRSFGLEVVNPPNAPTHIRGAALDLVIATPGLVQDVQVHNNYHCSCPNRDWCCPMPGSDHFVVTIELKKSRPATSGDDCATARHVRDWGQLIRSQYGRIEAWTTRVHAQLATLPGTTRVESRAIFDELYNNVLDIVWNADPSLYRRARPNSKKQPSWWTDACFAALLRRNAAWRARNRDRCDATKTTFRVSRNHFHHVVRHAKSTYWSTWLSRVERMKAVNPRVAARWVRCRFRHNVSKVSPSLSPNAFADVGQQRQCMQELQHHFQNAAALDADNFCPVRFARVRRRIQRIRASRSSINTCPT